MTQLALPLVLIGPILRRVEPRSVSVFVATSTAAAMHLSVYDSIVDASNPWPGHSGADTAPAGDQHRCEWRIPRQAAIGV